LGDPRKPHKAFQTPRHPWRKDQLEEELHLVGDYGLRNKKELRIVETDLSQIRGIARTLLGEEEEQRGPLERQYLTSLSRKGILPESATVDNILDLNVKDLMERRLQTIVYRSGLAKSIHQARQFVIHGHISIAGSIVTAPSYIVRRDQESRIAFHQLSPLNNPSHPARAAPTGKRVSRIIEEAGVGPAAPATPTMPALPEVSPEVREEVQAEQPLVMPETETEEEAPAEGPEQKP
jgi:small subunit ribosomal protein S4